MIAVGLQWSIQRLKVEVLAGTATEADCCRGEEN